MDKLMQALKIQIQEKQPIEHEKLKAIERGLEEEKRKLVFVEPGGALAKIERLAVAEQKRLDEKTAMHKQEKPIAPSFMESRQAGIERIIEELQVEELKERIAGKLRPLEEELNELAVLRKKELEEKQAVSVKAEAELIAESIDVERIWKRLKQAEKKEAEVIAKRIDGEKIFDRLRKEAIKEAEHIQSRVERHERKINKTKGGRKGKKQKTLFEAMEKKGIEEMLVDLVKTVEKEKKDYAG
ncbi:hypothetical protein HZB89_00820 [archaeon]|nr:hypothetical protein [archaeon]